jgi:hypothetical protein
MKVVNISRRDLDNFQRSNREASSFVEAEVVGAYSGFTSAFTDTDQYDIVGSGDTVAEVKHCFRRLSDGKKGRFRLFKPQHDFLVRYDRRATAYYVLVLVEPDNQRLKMIRQKPAAVGRIVGARGGWNKSGHTAGRQHKLPWGVYFD